MVFDPKAALGSVLSKLGIALCSSAHLSKVEERAELNHREVLRLRRQIELLAVLPFGNISALAGAAAKAQSQNGQDLFVLAQTGLKQGGYFVDFGATDGHSINNSFLLEREFGWEGIVAEPAKTWHDRLRRNRRCHIDQGCVWTRSGETICFNQVADAELSTIEEFSESDNHALKRAEGESYHVETISLTDLLIKYKAPSVIDYLSMDTEGSEFEILNAFDFDRYSFRIITCEHNYTPARERIFRLLSAKGYQRRFETLSKWDDWYIKEI